MADMSELLTTPEAAEVLHSPVATLRWWRHKGIGPKSFRMGPRKVMYRLGDLQEWLETQYNAEGVGLDSGRPQRRGGRVMTEAPTNEDAPVVNPAASTAGDEGKSRHPSRSRTNDRR
jgi:predicted DNA-binding transcriptional regulator AlpA